MARVRKAQPSLDSLFFSTPEQKVLRFLLSEPTTAFTPRVISTKLKGVRGLGGTEGITKVLHELQAIGLLDFIDNHRAVRIQDDNPVVQLLKTFAAICDLEGIKSLLQPISSRGVLYGCRADGQAHSDSEYELFVVSETPDEVERVTGSHPMGRKILLKTATPEAYHELGRRDASLAQKLGRGIVVWSTSW